VLRRLIPPSNVAFDKRQDFLEEFVQVAPPGSVYCKTAEILPPERVTRLLSHFARSWKPCVNPLHPLDSIINRIAERIFSCGRWPAIQSRQLGSQKHPGGRLYQFLSPLVHCDRRISFSLYVRLVFSEVRISSVFPPFLTA
jgi:hypothetical protein